MNAINLFNKWPGLPGLRQVLVESGLRARDGVRSRGWSDQYPTGEIADALGIDWEVLQTFSQPALRPVDEPPQVGVGEIAEPPTATAMIEAARHMKADSNPRPSPLKNSVFRSDEMEDAAVCRDLNEPRRSEDNFRTKSASAEELEGIKAFQSAHAVDKETLGWIAQPVRVSSIVESMHGAIIGRF